MRKFGIIHTRYWAWCLEKNLADHERVIGAYLMSSEHGNTLGCFKQPPSYTAEDLGYPIKRVSTAYQKFIDLDFLAYCERSKYILIRKYLLWNRVQNPKHGKAICKVAMQIPSSCQIGEYIVDSLIHYGGKYIPYTLSDTLYNTLCKKVSKPYRDSGSSSESDRGSDSEITTLSGKPDDANSGTPPFEKIISYLNTKTGRNYRPDTHGTKKLIQARWKEGYSLDDFETVIDNQVARWLNDPHWSTFLRPETLFTGDHFESYLNAGDKVSTGSRLTDGNIQAGMSFIQKQRAVNDE